MYNSKQSYRLQDTTQLEHVACGLWLVGKKHVAGGRWEKLEACGLWHVACRKHLQATGYKLLATGYLQATGYKLQAISPTHHPPPINSLR
jgi:hypothetical protein